MAYIGKGPINTSTGLFAQDTFTGDGSTTTFDLSNRVPDGGDNDIQVFVDNVRQQAGTGKAYTLGLDGSGDLKRVTFTTAPAAAQAIFVLNPGTRNHQVSTPSDNTITSAKIVDGAIVGADINSTFDVSAKTVTLPATVSGLATGISNAQVAADAIDESKIANAAIESEHLHIKSITEQTQLAAARTDDDELLIYDTSAGTLKRIAASNVGILAPNVTSVSPTNVTTGDGTGNHTFVIAGTNFAAGSTASLINTSGSTVAFDSVTRNSAIQVTGVIAKSSLLNSGEPFDVRVTSNGINSDLLNQINVDAQPVFVTASGSLGTGNEGAALNVTVNATDPESAGNVTFELQSGSMGGLTLTNEGTEGGTARIAGTLPQVNTTTVFNFVLRAVDAASNTSSRSFSITSTQVPVRSSFTANGTFAVPAGVTAIDVLAVAGGAGSQPGSSGGGGAGGLIYMPGYPVTTGTLAITVGGGGSACSGQDSIVGGSPSPAVTPTGGILTAKGGGRGNTSHGSDGGAGGGGGTATSPVSNAGQGIQGQEPGNSGAYGFGFDGGSGNPFSAGGGGGAGAGGVGGHGNANGGDGKAYTIADGTTSVYYAGGGGAVRPSVCTQGGQGGGGGTPNGGTGQAGQSNKGGGSGGNNGSGGKGIVIVAY